MRKTVFAAIIALLAVTCLAFAGGTPEPKAAAGGKVTLSMYAYNERTNPVEAPNWDYALGIFRATNPDVDLQIEFGFTEPYHDKMKIMVAANQIPDLMFLWPDKRTGYLTEKGLAKDLTPYVKGHEKEFVPGALAPQIAGGLWEIPEQVTDCHVVYTNTKLLKQLGLTYPKTFEEMVKQAPAILAKGLIPVAMDDKDGWQMQSCLLGALIERTGGKAWFDKAIKGKEGKFTDPEFVNALSVIETMAKNKMLSPGIVQADYGVAVTDFANEKAVYMIDGGWRVNALVGVVKPEQKKDIELNTFPDLAGMKGTPGSTSSVVGTGYGMSASLTGAKAEAAWKWIWFYAGPVDSAIRQGFGANPAYILPKRTDLDPLILKLIDFVNKTPGGYVVDSVLDADGMKVIQPAMQELILGSKTAQQVAAEFEKWVAANDSGRK